MCKFVGFLRVLDRPENNAILFRVKKGTIRQGKNAFPTLNVDLKMLLTLSSPQKSEVRDSPPLKREVGGGSVAEWSVRRTRNPVVPGSSPALATCWICSQSARVQIFGHAYK